MNRVKLIVAEAVRSLGANVSTTFAATTTVLIGMFMLGLVVGLGSWALSLSDHYKKQLLVKVYFCTRLTCDRDATTGEKDAVHNQLITMPQVKSLHYISREEAYEDLATFLTDGIAGASAAPAPTVVRAGARAVAPSVTKEETVTRISEDLVAQGSRSRS